MAKKVESTPRGTRTKQNRADKNTEHNLDAIRFVGESEVLSKSGLITNDISPKRLENIYRSAHSAGNLGALYEFYKKIEAYDSKLKGLLSKRRRGVSKFGWELEVTDEGKDSGQSEKIEQAIKFINKTISRKSFRFNSFRKSALDGLLYGMKILVTTPFKDGEMLSYKNWKEIPVQSYRQKTYTLNKENRDQPFIEFKGGESLFINDISPFQIAPFFAESSVGDYDINGLMRPIGRWFTVKNLIIRYWVDYDRVHGFPTTVLKVSPNMYKKYKNEFDNFIKSMSRSKYGVLFTGSSYEIHSDSKAGATDVFKEFLRYADNEMAINIWGQNTSTTDEQGSYAKSTELRKDEIDIVINDALWQDEIINKYVIDQLILANFIDVDPNWIKYRTKVPKNRNWSQVKEKYELAMRSNLSVDRVQFENEVGIKVKPQKDEDGNESDWIDLAMAKQQTNNHNPEIDDLDSDKRKDQRKDGGSVAE